jgi:phosphohistidine phosphatase
MGEAIAARRPLPERVLCSSARRTRETLEGILPHLPEALDVVIDRDLYLADPERILARIADVDDGVRTLLVVGHNPGIAELAELLAAEGDPSSLERLRAKFPTGALAEIQALAVRWRDLAPGSGMLTAFLTPRELAGRDG